MKKTVSPGPIPEAWDPDALFLKARYAQHMAEDEGGSWEYALWSSLSLELLARAALANGSPALLADTNRNWSSLYYSLGFSPTESKFAPKSISITDVLRRLSSIIPSFNQELESFCVVRTGRRNRELHSGETTFDGVPGSSWQPRFFQACEALLGSMVALVNGEPISVPNQKLEDDQIIESQQFLPSIFECIACSLKILGLSRLSAVGLGDRYTKTQTYDAAEYYAPEDEYAGYDVDNNEYYSPAGR